MDEVISPRQEFEDSFPPKKLFKLKKLLPVLSFLVSLEERQEDDYHSGLLDIEHNFGASEDFVDPAFDPSFFYPNAGDTEDSTEDLPPWFPLPKAHAPPPSESSTASSALMALNLELRTLASSNAKFEAFPPHRIFETANWLVAYGIPTLEAFRTTDEIARRYLVEDLRKTEKLTFPQLSFLFKLARHIPPHDQKVSEKNMRFTELDIPKALESYAPPLSSLSAFFLPDQDQVNWIKKEVAIAASKDPPFVPYLAPKLWEHPWMPSDQDHTGARSRWLGYSKQAKRSIAPQTMTIQAFALYHLRFVFAADLCKAWQPFGGLGPQFAHLSSVLHLSVTESVGIALAYHRLVCQKLQEKARRRAPALADFTALLAAESFTLKEQAKKEIAMAVDADLKEKALKTKATGKGKKGDKGQPPRGKQNFHNRQNADNREAPTHEEASDLYYRREGDSKRDDDNRRQDRSRSRNRQQQNRQRGNQNYGPNNRGRQNTGRQQQQQR